MNDEQELARLLNRGHTCICVSTLEEEYTLGLIRNAALNADRGLWIWSIAGGVQDGLFTSAPCVPETESPVAGLTYFADLPERSLCVALDLASHLRDERTLRVLRNLLQQFQSTRRQLILLDWKEELPQVIRDYATEFRLSLPDDAEVEQIIAATLRKAREDGPLEVSIRRSTLRVMIRNLRGLPRRQIERIINDAVVLDRRLDDSDLNAVLAQKRQILQHGSLLQFVQTPVDLSEIGGLRRLKAWLEQRAPATHEHAKDYGLVAPRGVLMLGVQGAGKSLCAKAIATAWQQPLLRMDVGALYDRYIGESERRLRDTFAQAERMAPIVLWIDEIEKAFASAASHNTDGGLSQRMFGSLLTWMQEHTAPVFIVATANNIDALPPELLRKGRFDEVFFVDLPNEEVRRQIFGIHLRKRRRDPKQFDLQALAVASDGFSGAEIEQAVIAGLHRAFSASTELSTDHILQAIMGSPPLSVTMAEHVAALRQWAIGRCVPAD